MFGRGGSSSGVAEGQFRIDVRQIQEARRHVEEASRAMGAAFREAGTGATSGTKTINSALSETEKQALSTQRVLEGLFSTAFLARGIRAAQNLQQIDTMFKVLSGSQEKTNRNMAQLEKLSERTGTPMIRLREAASGILTTVGRSNIELDKTVSLAQRLAILDPFQGFTGASIALREFLSGTPRSLAHRFELPLSRLKQITESAGGDPQKLIEGLDKLINELGLTEDALAELNRSGVNAFENFGATIEEALGNAFRPMRDMVVLILQGFMQLNAQQPALVQTALSVAAITAALIAMRFAAQQAKSALSGLGIGRDFGRLLVAGAGLQLGLGISQALAERTQISQFRAGPLSGADLGRLTGENAETPQAVLSERLNQILVVTTEGFRLIAQAAVDLVEVWANAGQLIRNGFDLVGAALSFGVNVIKEGFGSFQEAIGTFLVRFADAFSGVFDTTAIGQAGLANIDIGSRNRFEAQAQRERDAARLQQGIGITPEQTAAMQAGLQPVREGIDSAFRDFQLSLVKFLFPALDDTEKKIQQTSNALQQAFEQLKPAMDDIAGEVQDLAEEFEQESQRIADARSLVDAREQFDAALANARQIRDFNRGLAQSDADFYRGRAKQVRDFYAGVDDLEGEAEAQRLDQLEAFRREDLRRAEDFGEKLAQIEAETKLNVAEAARRLDARTAFEAARRGELQVDNVTKQFQKENGRRDEDFQLQQQQLVDNLRKQREGRVAAFRQQLADQLEEFNLSRQRRLEAFSIQQQDADVDRQLRLQRLVEDREIEDRLRREGLAKKIRDLVEAVSKENVLNVFFMKSFGQVLTGIRNGTLTTFNDIKNGINQALSQIGTVTVQRRPATVVRGATRTFQHGGFPPLNELVGLHPGESGLIGGNLALFTRPATIFNADQTRRLLSGAGGGNFTWTGDIVLGDIGDRTDSGA